MNAVATLIVFSQLLTVIAIGALLTRMPQLGFDQVQGRAPGSSDHASPIRRTEARAERTLDPARPEKAFARECGECFSPRAPEPSAARVGWQGQSPWCVTRVQRLTKTICEQL